MKLFDIDGKKTAILNMFIDPENGFLKLGLTDEDGGVLYVPGGEEVAPVMGGIIEKSRGSIFIIGQDYHPGNHISFMVNHPGVMDYRKEQFKKFLTAHGQPEPETDEELTKRAQQPVHFFDSQPPAEFPFPELVLDENRDIIGLKEADGRIREVRVDTESGGKPSKEDRGRVGKVLDRYHRKTFDQYRAEGRLLSTQSLWTMHCVQGTPSSLYPDELKLPQGLKAKLEKDKKSDYIHYHDPSTDNDFYVIRKGADPELDSYGIGVENDYETMTVAWEVFQKIATDLKRMGCQQVKIRGGGLAANICSEYSLNNTQDFLAGLFRMRGMQVDISYVPEISRGIPIPGDEKTPFSLVGTEFRLASRGIGTTSVKEMLSIYSEHPLVPPRYTIDGPATGSSPS